MTAQTFYPKTHLFPHHPQVLHQMVLHFFLVAEKYEHIFTGQKMSHALIMPYGSYFEVGPMQAAGYRYRLQDSKPEKIVLITFADMPEEITSLGCSYSALHTFFGELSVNHQYDKKIGMTIDNELFEKYADPIVCQLPFLRSYQKIDSIVPIIINKKNPHLSGEKMRKTIWDDTGKTGYIICENIIDAPIKDFAAHYGQVTSEPLMTFGQE